MELAPLSVKSQRLKYITSLLPYYLAIIDLIFSEHNFVDDSLVDDGIKLSCMRCGMNNLKLRVGPTGYRTSHFLNQM